MINETKIPHVIYSFSVILHAGLTYNLLSISDLATYKQFSHQ